MGLDGDRFHAEKTAELKYGVAYLLGVVINHQVVNRTELIARAVINISSLDFSRTNSGKWMRNLPSHYRNAWQSGVSAKCPLRGQTMAAF